MIKGQDILVLLKLFLLGKQKLSMAKISVSLGISSSEVCEGMKRLVISGLLDNELKVPIKSAMEEFLIHGFKYFFPAKLGSIDRGIPTAVSAFPFNNKIISSGSENYVWAYHNGNSKGIVIEPLYNSVPEAIMNDNKLYELLIILDVLRLGKIREQEIAKEELVKRIRGE
jgi:hypothetical protein